MILEKNRILLGEFFKLLSVPSIRASCQDSINQSINMCLFAQNKKIS